MKNTWQVATAAEAFAAAQFARCGWDVSVQYGANQPEYDLVVVDGERALKVSVKGSKDGGWGLSQSFKKGRSYREAADAWLAKHKAKTLFCFVQFEDIPLTEMPRVYLATPNEVAAQLKAAAGGRGDTILSGLHTWTDRAAGKGTTDRVPPHWRFTKARLEDLVSKLG